MFDADKSTRITRREFYSALGVLWMYNALILCALANIERRWTTLILLCVSVFTAFGYIVTGLRLGRIAEVVLRRGLPPSG
jgi:hypothetical protein